MNAIEEKLQGFKHRVLVALAAAAAERASCFFKAPGGLNHRALLEAIQMAWDYAQGSGIAPQRISTVRSELSALIPNIRDDVDKQPTMSAGVAGLYALDAISDPTPRSTARAFSAALDAVISAAENPETAEDAEMSWRQFILGVGQSVQEGSVTRAAFLNAEHPLKLH